MRRSTILFLLPILLPAVVVGLWGDVRSASGQPLRAVADRQVPAIETTVLATRLLVEVPGRALGASSAPSARRGRGRAPPAGFVYAAAGQSILVVVEAQGIVMSEGQAAWAPEDIAHLHRSQTRTSSQAYGASTPGVEIWTILLERPAEARQPGALAMSPLLTGLQPGPYEVRLVAETYRARRVDGASAARPGPSLPMCSTAPGS